MLQLSCLAHRHANVVDARARVRANGVGSALWLSGFMTAFETITKPYASQRPSGAPPG